MIVTSQTLLTRVARCAFRILVQPQFYSSSQLISLKHFKHSSLKHQFDCDLESKVFQKSYKQNNSSYDPKALWSWDMLTTILIFFGVIEDLEKKDSPLILSIKRGILSMQRGEHHKAELILHTSLKMAQDLCYTDAETYIFDLMADNYFEKGDYHKARQLFLEVLARLSRKEDFTLDGEGLVEISIKLAFCYGRLGEVDSAEKGLQFAIDTQLGRVESFWDDRGSKATVDKLDEQQRNSLALLGMSYDYYSKHLELRSTTLLSRALAYRLKALAISRQVNGVRHEQTLVLENDVADLYAQMQQFDKAKSHLRRAIEGAKEVESSDLPLFYLNMASVHCHENRHDLAKPFCKKSFDFILKSKDQLSEKERKELMEKSELCLNGSKFY